MKALFISRFDSFTATSKVIEQDLASGGWVTERVLLAKSKQVAQAISGNNNYLVLKDINMLFTECHLQDYQLVIMIDTGVAIKRFMLNLLHQYGSHRPLVLTAYPGVLFKEINTGFANRCGVDGILFNCPYEYQLYQNFCAKHQLSNNGYLWGWNFASTKTVQRVQHNEPKTIRTYVFADQDVIPQSKLERHYLAQKIIELATKRLDLQVIVKLRTSSSKCNLAVFKAQYPLVELIQNSEQNLPKNLLFKTGSMADILQDCDMLVTISSTAAIEAMLLGIPTAIISDFGDIDDNGTEYFADSGCLLSFADLINGVQVHEPTHAWQQSHLATHVDRMGVIAKILSIAPKGELTSSNYLKVFAREFLDTYLFKNQLGKQRQTIAHKLCTYWRRLVKLLR